MERSFVTLVVLTLAGAAAAASAAPPPDLVVPRDGLVLDGGDVEAAASTPSLAASVLAASAPALQSTATAQATPARRPVAFEYSDGYRTRLKIHKYASYATLPLFVAQFAVGQKLYDGNASDGTKTLHGVLAGTTAVLFGVNTVTGIWNLSEGRKDPSHRTKRMVHGILMAVADAGFVATGIMTPEGGHEGGEFGFESGGTSRSTHRAVALTSMGIATVGYLMMLIH